MAATASHAHRAIEWYVITDEADLTLRITSGLRVGEDRWGELTLNHPVAAHRWLEFTIEQDGNLSARPCRRDVVIEIDGEPQSLLSLQPGDPIQLPHNRVHISDSFKRGPSDAAPAVVRCVEVDERNEDDGVPTLEQIVITESDLPQATPSPRSAPRRQDTQGYQNALADKLAERINLPEARTTRTHDSIETALIPVDAESPFAANEVSESLRRPIDSTPRRAQRGAANSPVMTPAVAPKVTTSRYAPRLDTTYRERRSYTYLWSLSAILGIGLIAAMLVAIYGTNKQSNGTAVTRDNGVDGATANTPGAPTMPTRTEELLASVQNIIARSPEDDPAAWEFAVRSYEYILAQEPENTVVRRRLAAARTRVAALRAQEQIHQEALAAQSNNNNPVATTTPAPTLAPAPTSVPTPAPETTASVNEGVIDTVADAVVGQTVGDQAVLNQARPTVVQQSPLEPSPTVLGSETAPTMEAPIETFELPQSASAYAEPLSPEQVESRLRLARQRLAEGQIISPYGSSASALTLSVLATDPSHREAINLLNGCADLMVTQAELAYAAGDAFQARNSLEEVFAFHPRHRRANERWLEWTGSPSRYR